MSPPVLVFLVILPSTSFHRIKAHSLPHIQLFLQLRSCDKLVLLPKTYKIPPSSNFSVRTHYNCALEQRQGAITNLRDLLPKEDLQCQSFINTVTQHQNTVQRDSCSRTQTGLSEVELGDFATMLHDLYVY